MTPEQIERFWSRVEKTETCWLWTGYICKTGYGQFKFNGISHNSHRLSLALHLGRPLAPRMFACHAPHSTCGNRHCVNPAHLFEKSPQGNSDDRIADGTARRKLTESQVYAIRDDTRSSRKIAVDYGIAAITVNEIKNRKIWKHLPEQNSTPQ